MKNLSKMISKYMRTITLLLVLGTILVVVIVHILSEQERAHEEAERTFIQMEQVLEENQKDLAQIEAEYKDTCLKNAEAVDYIIQHNPTIMESVEEMKKIAEFLEIDEIHIFDENGKVYNGTNPEYFGLTMDSGEQISYFLPLLKDKSLRLCQDIAPNTAENKMMQYSALWSNTGDFIVQVGMEPVNVLKVTEKNELSYIFSLLSVDVGANYYAIDMKNGEIVGTTVSDDVGKNLTDVGLVFKDFEKDAFHANVNGVDCYCVFKEIDGNYIGRIVSNDILYQRVPANVLGFSFSLILVAFMLYMAVTQYMKVYVIRGIYNINDKLREITAGNLEKTVDVKTSLEFAELSEHINDMINSLLTNTEKISYVLDKTNMNIGVYEYNVNMKKVRFTEHVPHILVLDMAKSMHLSSDYRLFKGYMEKLRENKVIDEEGVFCIEGDTEIFVKNEEVTRGNEVFGIIMDVTEEFEKRKKIEIERDIDLLTGLYNRRGMERKLDILFAEPEKLGYGALVMIDADGLKGINDKYGHEKGDIYLKKIAETLGSFGAKSCVAARQGGDEFVLFLYDYDTEKELIDCIETLKFVQDNSLARLSEDLSVPLGFSLGYSLTKDENDYQGLLKEADRKMYDDKRERKKSMK